MFLHIFTFNGYKRLYDARFLWSSADVLDLSRCLPYFPVIRQCWHCMTKFTMNSLKFIKPLFRGGAVISCGEGINSRDVPVISRGEDINSRDVPVISCGEDINSRDVHIFSSK